jgi:Uma2 family endonuclease
MHIAQAAFMQHVLASSPFVPRTIVPVPSMAQSFFARWVARREWEAHRYELVGGRIVRRPPLRQACAALALRLQRRLAQAATGQGVIVLEPRQGLELPTGDTLVPDVAVLSAARWATTTPGAGDLLRVVPELVVEILRAPADRRAHTREIWERAGVHEHWLVDPHTRTVTVLVRRRDRIELGEVLAGTDTLRPTLLPGCALAVARLF